MLVLALIQGQDLVHGLVEPPVYYGSVSSCVTSLSLFLPPQRPLAISVVGQMKDPTFATFMYLLPCGKQSSFFCSLGQEYTVVFWDGKEDTR